MAQTQNSAPKTSQKFSATAIRALAQAQAQNPTASIEELAVLAGTIYEQLKAQSKTVNGDAYTRATAIAEILKAHPTMEKKAVIKKADAAYCAKTGRESNIRETTFTYAHVYHALLVFELVK